MKKYVFMANKRCITGVYVVALLVISCVSAPWENITFLGEDEKLLSDLRWDFLVTYTFDGRKYWYFIDLKSNGQVVWSPARHSKSLSRNSTWERNGKIFRMTANNGQILFEGDITIDGDVVNVEGIVRLYNGSVHKFEMQKSIDFK
jgi:hypothetical protein